MESIGRRIFVERVARDYWLVNIKTEVREIELCLTFIFDETFELL